MEMPPPPPPPPRRPAAAPAGGKPDRKTVERGRRNQMNALYSRLDNLVRAGGGAAPSPAPAATRPDRLGEAAAYITQTAERVERLKDRKRELTACRATAPTTEAGSGSGSGSSQLLEVQVQHLGSGLHAILVTGGPPSDGASFHRAVRAVEEAGGEVQNAHFSVVAARAVYTIHALVGEQPGSIERVVQRLKEAVRGNGR